MQPVTYAAGVRQRYEDLPAAVRRWVEVQLGGRVITVLNTTGGFSPGVAAVVTSEHGQELFVKAVGSAVNADSLRFYRAERTVTLRIPAVDGVLRPTAWTDLEVSGESFAVLTFPALAGGTPPHPWQSEVLTTTLAALQQMSAQLTPSPWPREAGDRRLTDFFRWWERITGDVDDPWSDDPWITGRRTQLRAAEDQLRAELPGRTLSHTDLRADNIMVSPQRIWFVDWAHAQNAAAWVDAAILIADVVGSRADLADGGEIDVAAVIRSHFAGRASFDTVWRLMVGLAGAMHGMSRQPDPPGLPTIRTWQAATAITLLDWSRRESPEG